MSKNQNISKSAPKTEKLLGEMDKKGQKNSEAGNPLKIGDIKTPEEDVQDIEQIKEEAKTISGILSDINTLGTSQDQ